MSDLLNVLDPEGRRAVLATARLRSWKRGDVLFREDDPGDTLHLIRKGHLAVRASHRSGDEATLAVLGPGDSCGEQALLAPRHRRTATVSALDAADTLVIGRAEFERLRAEHPGVDRLLVEVLAAQVRRLSAQVMEALFVPAETRVVRRLVDLVALFGAVVPITQEELGGLAGTTRPTANRALRPLVEAGALRLARGRVEVLDLDAVRRQAR